MARGGHDRCTSIQRTAGSSGVAIWVRIFAIRRCRLDEPLRSPNQLFPLAVLSIDPLGENGVNRPPRRFSRGEETGFLRLCRDPASGPHPQVILGFGRRCQPRPISSLTGRPVSGILYDVKSFNIRHIQHHLATVLADVEQGEEIEVLRRGRPVARIVPLPSAPTRADWSHAARRLQAAYPELRKSGTTAARLIADGRGER